jgi:hypothetical protein
MSLCIVNLETLKVDGINRRTTPQNEVEDRATLLKDAETRFRALLANRGLGLLTALVVLWVLF